ncbi:MAG: carboxy terminal-processing peptidase [Bacteroidota bacterium]|nr:carboxy terminal-processing peptidase [Bacteroidota bacterium]MDP4211523.1 carboxy terminal-processing peptidase [Bacteroidota bacterium]MDP4249738.1 carboxy terminal-processing peptidase [Bacteroidota bacterium]
MFNKRNLPIVLLVSVLGVALALKTFAFSSEPPTKYEKILRNVGEMLEEVHYSPKNIDDSFSREVFTKFLSEVDLEKKAFLKSDIQELAKYQTTIDDEILGNAPVQFVPAVDVIYKKRLQQLQSICHEILSQPFDYSKQESVNLDYDKMDFPANEAARRDEVRKKLKYLTLEKYADLLDQQTAAKGKPGYVAKTNMQLEKEAREKTLKIMDRFYDHQLLKANDDDQFNAFVETIVQCMDPHTDYFPPVERRSFDEDMSGRFFGIGAALRDEDGAIKIITLVTGSPAWKSGQINVGDVILKVAQGNQEPVDLTSYMVEDAVKIIRGNKGTEVRLTLKKADGTIKVVSLIRDEIIQDEKFAKSVVVQTAKGKIGYIFLPEFYADFDNPNGNRCSVDVAREIVKLKDAKVDGIVMDLRNNGGGSLFDVVKMVGLFIDQGPVVQVRDRRGNPEIYSDHDKSVLYDGPLAVMVNEFSASASEIFAAAIQDYKRGVIIGSTTTYGKGTVQRNIPLDKNMGLSDVGGPLGTIKLTLQKFYRINGGSTQLRGVSSDIVLPDLYEHYKIREKDQPDALPWDEMPKADYATWKYAYDVNFIRNESIERTKLNPSFTTISGNAAWLDKQNDKQYPLNLDEYRLEQQKIRATVKQIDSVSKLIVPMKITTMPEDTAKYDKDKDKADRYKQWLDSRKTDIYLKEAVNVMDDMISRRNLVYNK